MTITQGTFSFLPPLSDIDLERQLRYAIDHGWGFGIEHTDDPHPRNIYWDLWGLPLFDITDPVIVMDELAACHAAFPAHYVRLDVYDVSRHRRGIRMRILVHRPDPEPELRLERQELPGRRVGYVLHVRPTIAEEG